MVYPKRKVSRLSLDCIAQQVGAEVPVRRDGSRFEQDIFITGLATLYHATQNELVFYAHPFYKTQLSSTQAGGCFLKPTDKDLVLRNDLPLLFTQDPMLAFSRTIDLFFDHKTSYIYGGGQWEEDDGFEITSENVRVHRTAFVHPTAKLKCDVVVEAFAYLGPSCEIASGTVVSAHAVVGVGCQIGRDSFIGPHVSLACCVLGERVIVHAGARIGQDGFGYDSGGGKIPHVGKVIIHDDVEIGANTAVDRALITETCVGSSTKIDNLVQVGHNATLGKACFIVSQAGIAGSATLSDRVHIGGQVGIIDHIVVGSGARVAAGCKVYKDVPEKGAWFGIPGQSKLDYFRKETRLNHLIKDRKKNEKSYLEESEKMLVPEGNKQ